MHIETECPGCRKRLRVSAEHAGHEARCPVCSTIYSVPGNKVEVPISAAPEGESWSMRTPEGQLYGPVEKGELDRWVAEGRVTADCELTARAEGGWQPADVYYPVLRPTAESKTQTPTQQRYRYTAPHRGVLVLILGILGWLAFCPLFGVFAWIMGAADMREIQAGRMDPSGRGLTQAGMILGMIQTLIAIGGLVIFLFAALVRVVT